MASTVARRRQQILLVAPLLLIAALLFLRLSIYLVPGYQGDIRAALAAELGLPVSIADIDAAWRGWSPVLTARGIELQPGDDQPSLHIGGLQARIDLLGSLSHGKLLLSGLTLTGIDLDVVRLADGRFQVLNTTLGDQPADGDTDSALQDWLLGLDQIQLRDTRVKWLSRKTGHQLNLVGKALELLNHDGRHEVRGQLFVADQPDNRFAIVAQLDGDPSTSDWTLNAHLDITNLPLPLLLDFVPVHGDVTASAGRVDLKAWLSLRGRQLQSLQAALSAHSLTLSHDGIALPVQRIDTVLSVTPDADNFRLVADQIQARLDSGNIVSGDVELRLANGDYRLTASGGHLDTLQLAELTRALPLLDRWQPAIAEQIRKLAPEGRFSDANWSWQQDPAGRHHYQLQARFADLGINASDDVPGFKRLSGVLRADELETRLQLVDSYLQLDAPTLFPKPLRLQSVTGNVHLFPGENLHIGFPDLRISTLHSHIHLAGFLQTRANGAPFLFLNGNADKLDVMHLDDYLPKGIMNPDTLEWLDGGLPAGTASDIGFLFHGVVDKFPFDHGEGRFEARLHSDDMTVNYADDYPPLTKLVAEARFIGREAFIEAESANIFDAEIRNVSAYIPDIDAFDPWLYLTGKATMSGATGFRFLRESPIREKLGDFLAGTTIGGPMALDLKLDVPLGAGDTSVEGRLHFSDSTVDSRNFALVLQQVSGQMRFTETVISATDMQATLSGEPVLVSLQNQSRQDADTVDLSIRGKSNEKGLARIWAENANPGEALPFFFDYLSGNTTWSASVAVRQDATTGRTSDPELTFRADMRGMAVTLPAPAGKPADLARPLTVRTTLVSKGTQQVNLTIPELLSGSMLFAEHGSGRELSGGTLYVGDTDGAPIDSPGLDIVVATERFSITDWLAVFAPDSAPTSTDEPSRLHSFTVKAGQLEVIGRQIDSATLTATRAAAAWNVDIDAAMIRGTVAVPDDLVHGTLSADLDYLAIVGDATEQAATPPDPSTLPALHIHADSFKYGELALGALDLQTRRSEAGMEVSSMRLDADALAVQAYGSWHYTPDEHRSEFNISVDSPDVGKMLAAMGYSENAMKGGHASFTLDAAWIGSPMGFSLEILNGAATFASEDGELIDIDPGAGRIFGLLSLQTLPRRLKLDFSDLFSKGLAYDEIKGSFAIDDGDAYTNNLYMQTPAARVDIAGRAGLVSRDYDQIVTVTPDVSSTLPVAGAITAGPVGAAIGAAASFLANTLLKSEVDTVVTRQYHITGPWADPRIDEIKAATKTDPDATAETDE